MARRNRTANASPGDPLWTSHLKPAPGELRIVQAFVSTEGDAKATDEIASPRGIAVVTPGQLLHEIGVIP